MGITKSICEQMTDGILNLMREMGMWLGETPEPRKPIISEDPDDVSYLNASTAGVFVPSVKHWVHLKEGEEIGQIIDPLKGDVLARVMDSYEGEVIQTLTAPVDGIVFFSHNEPLTYANTAVFKLIGKYQ